MTASPAHRQSTSRTTQHDACHLHPQLPYAAVNPFADPSPPPPSHPSLPPQVTFTYPGAPKPQLEQVTCSCRLSSRVAILGG